MTGLVTGIGNAIFNIVVARTGGADAYGALGPLLAFATIAGVLGTGVQYAVAGRVAQSRTTQRQQIALALRALLPWLLLSLALLALVPLATAYLRLRGELPAVLTVGLFMSSLATAIPMGILVGDRRFGLIAFANVAMVALRVALGAVLTRRTDPTSGALLASLLAPLVIMAILIGFLAWRGTPGTRVPMTGGAGVAGVGAEGAAGAAYATALWGIWSLPLLFARHWMAPAVAGRFAAAQLLCGAVFFVAAPVVTAFYPAVVARASQRLVATGMAATLGVTALGVTAVGTLGPVVMRFAYGSEFVTDRPLLVSLGLSAMAVSAANYLVWVMRALRAGSRLVVALVASAVVVELGLGDVIRANPTMLAGVPAACVVIALCAGVLVAWTRRAPSPRPVSSGSSLLSRALR
jgi:O-antigen/teichoic acid export membrane protein